MSKLADFLSELKRRRVFRVTAVYAGVAFIISEIVANTFGDFGIPDYFNRAVYILLILGFPIAVGLAWAFDMTDKGIVRTKSRHEATKPKVPHPLVGNKSLAVIAVLAIIVAVWALLRGPSVLKPSGVRIGVLPFVNLSADSTLDVYADQITAKMINELAGIGNLEVIGSTTMRTYKGESKDLKTIGEELDADALLEGEILKGGETVQMIAQLIDPRTQGHLWNETYDREDDPSRILIIISEIAQEVAEALRIQLTPQEEERLASAPKVDPEAYDSYVLGWHFRNQETPESIALAVEYLEQAVAIDPDYADAWAALVPVYQLARVLGLTNDSTVTWLSMKSEALERALKLDPNNVTALVWKGLADESGGNEAFFQQALELEPNNLYARYEYGLYLARNMHQPHESLAELLLARELDPVNPLPLYGLGWTYWYLRMYDKVLEYEQAALEISPGLEGALIFFNLANLNILIEQGRYTEAAAGASRALAEEPVSFAPYFILWALLRAESAQGDRETLYAIRDSLIDAGSLPRQEHEDPQQYALLYAAMGEREQTLNLLETDYEAGSFLHRNGLVYNPVFDFLRAEPRFKAVLERWGLPEVFDENGNLIRPLDETLQAYNAPGSR